MSIYLATRSTVIGIIQFHQIEQLVRNKKVYDLFMDTLLAITAVTCAPNNALTAGASPGYGTKVILNLAVRLSISNAMCEVVAGPALAIVNSPGLSCAALT